MTATDQRKQQINTARITGVWYLALAISGVLGFLIFHPQVFISGDAEKTLVNLMQAESTARIRLLFEFAIVVSQAFAAVWFYKLFKGIHESAAWALGIWGMMNSMAIMVSAMAMASAISIAGAAVQPVGEVVAHISILQNLSSNAWGVGGLFFGLWLLPMGYIVTKSRRMPVWLGRVIILGGFGYLISTFFEYAGIDFYLNRFLTIPATIGEFWMIGYLLIFGIRPEN